MSTKQAKNLKIGDAIKVNDYRSPRFITEHSIDDDGNVAIQWQSRRVAEGKDRPRGGTSKRLTLKPTSKVQMWAEDVRPLNGSPVKVTKVAKAVEVIDDGEASIEDRMTAVEGGIAAILAKLA